jgi:hypothetical protein
MFQNYTQVETAVLWDVMWSGRYLGIFRSNILPPSTGQRKSKMSKEKHEMTIWRTTAGLGALSEYN